MSNSFENPLILNSEEKPDKEESIKSEKEILWEQKTTEVDGITDRIGERVDDKIKKSVVAFLIHEFATSASCEGHITEKGEDEHGFPFPWIEICTSEPEGLEESEEKKQEWTIENLKQQQRMMSFFDKFYKERETPFDARLAFERIGAFGSFRVQSFGAEMTALLTHKEQEQKLKLYQQEMVDFAEFLKEEFFSKE